jgi:hypothetical protein
LKIFKNTLAVLMIVPLFAVSFVIKDLRVAGYSPRESILMSLGATLPFVVVFGIAYCLVERRMNRPSD